MAQNYNIVSLGFNCFARTILTQRGIKPAKKDGELSLPFDLCVTPIQSIIKLLNKNFSDYFENLKFNKESNIWYNKKYNIFYHDDVDFNENNRTEIIKRYTNRIKNFQTIIKTSPFIYFVHCAMENTTQNDIKDLYKSLLRLLPKENFKLIILNFFDNNLNSENNISVISIKHPYKNFHSNWWLKKYRITPLGEAFEIKVVEEIKVIIAQKHEVQFYSSTNIKETNANEIYINFVDFPEYFTVKDTKRFNKYDNYITNILKKHYSPIITTEPDFLFYSVFGNEFEKYNDCVKIFYTSEVIVPNFNECDYAISYDRIDFDGRNLYHPFYFDLMDKAIIDKSHITPDMAKRKFCNFIYSNENCGEGAILRKEFCQKLMKYKRVDCPGKVLNNMQNAINGRFDNFNEGKLNFQKKYKFTIAFENNCSIGYTTEKLVHAFEGNTIPIYWGNPEVTKDFNPKAFINCHDYNSLDEVIQKVIELDNDDEAYLKMLREPCVNSDYKFDKQEQLEKFLINIIEKGNKPFNKNPNPLINKYGYVGPTFEDKIKGNKRLISALDKERARYRLLKNLTFGKKRVRYNEKYQETKNLLRELKD